MNTLVQFGSCGASWPENTTPIQRLKAISPYFDKVILVDPESSPSSSLHCDDYVQVSNFTVLEVWRVLNCHKCDQMVVWFGPSFRLAMIILFLRLFIRFRFVLDLYDHENLSSGIARAQGKWLQFFKYRAVEGFTNLAISRADLLVSAISEERFAKQVNRVKAVNGVAISLLSDIVGKIKVEPHSERVTVCYVGVISKERSGLLADIASAQFGAQIDLLLIGENDPGFVECLIQCASCHNTVNVLALGFTPWKKAMRLVASADICLYVFSTRPELDCVYPIKMGEYMELEKPIVASDSTAIREVFSNCPGVIRCDPSCPNDWVVAIKDLAGNASKRRSLGRENKYFVRRQLDWSITQADLLSRLRVLFSEKSNMESQ